MTPDKQSRVRMLRERGYSIARIAQMLNVHTYSVRWVLNHDTMLKRAEKKRRAKGQAMMRCGLCEQLGHNRRTCSTVAR